MPAAELLCALLAGEKICIADVGAADGLAKRWRPVAPALRIVAFEPDARSGVTADAERGADVTVVNRAAADREGRAELYLTRKPRCSSLYAPNRSVVDRYPDADRYDVLEARPIECTTVDLALARLGMPMDFLKIDTQGTEMDVLRGAHHSLEACLGIEVEVEFQPLYVGAAVFRDIDAYAHGLGFEIYDLRRTFFTRERAPREEQRKGQIVFGDALYFRHWETLRSRERVVKLAGVLAVYGFADTVMEIGRKCPLLTDGDRETLTALCGALHPIAGVEAERKDRFVGAGLQLV